MLMPSVASLFRLVTEFPLPALDFPPVSDHGGSAENFALSSAPATRPANREFSIEEIAKHRRPGDLWLLINDTVYDVSNFASRHPGGDLALLGVGGKESSDVFMAFHGPAVREGPLMKSLEIGKSERKLELSAFQNRVRAIERQLAAEGKFVTNYSFYAWKFLHVAVLAITALSAFALARKFFWATDGPGRGVLSHFLFAFGSVLLGLFWHQLAFLGHDFGHNSVSGTADGDLWGSILVTALFGVSGRWWKRNHNIHHIHTNSIECDPDIQHLPFIAVDEKILKPFWSTYYKKWMNFDKVAQFFVLYQYEVYYLAMAIARVNLYVQSIALLANLKVPVRHRKLEIAAMIFYFSWYFLLLAFLPSWTVRYYSFCIAHMVAGLVHVQITLSHFAMPAYSGPGYSNSKEGSQYFLLNQFHTTMNVRCSPSLDWFHGGLQFQLEHHLFPKLPRQNLREAAERFVKPLAKEFNLPYHEFDFLTANQVVRAKLLHSAQRARELTGNEKSWENIRQSPAWQLIMAEG